MIMVVAAVSPQHAWQQPILRLADTAVGVAVGALAAWAVMRVRAFLSPRSVSPGPAKVKVKVDYPDKPCVSRPRARAWSMASWSAVCDMSLMTCKT